MRRSVSILVVAALASLMAFGAAGAMAGDVGPLRGIRAGKAQRSEGKGEPLRQGASYVPGEVLVKFKAGAGPGDLGALRGRVAASAVKQLTSTGIMQLDVGTDVASALDVLRASPLVEYAEPDYVRSIGYLPNDNYYNGVVPVTVPANAQWNMKNLPSAGGIDMGDAWDVAPSGGSTTVVVAIIDTGVAYRNGGGFAQAPDLASTHFKQGYDFINNDQFADDDNGHGTHVCGTIAQSTNNTLGCAGIAFNTTIMPVKVLGQDGFGDDSQLIEGITFAADHGADVINMSLGGPPPNAAIEDALVYAFNKDVVICAAAGNNNVNGVEYPAAYPECVAVGATNIAGEKASYSNYGAALDVVAPGGGDYAAPGNKPYLVYQQTFAVDKQPSSSFAFRGKQGTSMATPHVAGVAALVRAKNPSWNASEVRGAIASSCYDLGAVGWDRTFGWGLIDANAALHAAKPSQVAPAPARLSPVFASGGTTAHLTINGTGFSPKTKVTLERESEAGVSGRSFAVTGNSRVTCDMPLGSAQPGLWDVVVESSTMLSGVLDGGFSIDNAANKTWYLAEGSTSHGFQEYILVQNPNSAGANVTVALMTPGGRLPDRNLSISANSRMTVFVNDIANDTDVSAKVTADQNIICERAMYWNNKIEGTDSVGVQSPSYTWYLAEGTTNYGFETFLLIQNPSNAVTNVEVTYMTASGPVAKAPFTIDGNSRYSINVADDLPATDMSFKVVADERVIAERSMYWDGRRGGHDSIGTDLPSTRWFLAEGSTDWGYDEYVLIENPQAVAADVVLTYMTPAGPVAEPSMSVPGGTRSTVHVNAALPSKDVSVMIASDIGVVAERSMYWNNGTGKAGHNQIGVPQPRQQCFLAEGSTNWGFDEWILVQNPNSTPANVGIDYMTTTGLVPKNAFVLAANSRVTVHVNSDVPLADLSARVYSNLPIIAERSMYWNNKGAGHCSIGLMK